MKTISNELHNQIKEYCEKHPITIDFDYRDSLSNKQIAKILESEDGLNDFENDLYEMNIDYIGETEQYFIKDVCEYFEDELTELEIEDKEDFIRENYLDYISVSMNTKQLFNIDINCLINVYSNYDCTNSFDTLETSDYLMQVYQRCKKGVKKSDFMYEHSNGAYGGSLFCFAFRTSLTNLIELKQQLKTGKTVFIPKGTQFGFFSSFQGTGSLFEKTTYKDFKLNIEEEGKNYNSKYDHIDIIADCEQSYSMDDVYGGIDIDEQDIKID